MPESVYAVIAYLPGRLGEFVDEQRDRLNPEYASALAHVTVLPPRPSIFPPDELLESLRKRCAHREPFDVAVEGVSTFWPANGVVFLSLAEGFDELLALHRELNVGDLRHAEPYPFVPHITVAQDLDDQATQEALVQLSNAWNRYDGEKTFRVESLCLVRQAEGTRWRNLATIPLSSFFYAVRSLEASAAGSYRSG
ncbi:MAG TPA: 2'-5' RNA ligase family protein [Terriglobia bacterium]|nr:2'-5' RNA ligase family protein [Terriglobia bacterium]